ncbi:MAG: aldehyde dehydrogenase family protein, partial [Terracidiphilus sp.]
MATEKQASKFTVHHALETLHKAGVRSKYDNFIGGQWVAPVKGKYFTDSSPINGEPLAEIAKSTPEDVEKALDAAHAVRYAWAHTSSTARAEILLKIAERIET